MKRAKRRLRRWSYIRRGWGPIKITYPDGSIQKFFGYLKSFLPTEDGMTATYEVLEGSCITIITNQSNEDRETGWFDRETYPDSNDSSSASAGTHSPQVD